MENRTRPVIDKIAKNRNDWANRNLFILCSLMVVQRILKNYCHKKWGESRKVPRLATYRFKTKTIQTCPRACKRYRMRKLTPLRWHSCGQKWRDWGTESYLESSRPKMLFLIIWEDTTLFTLFHFSNRCTNNSSWNWYQNGWKQTENISFLFIVFKICSAFFWQWFL